MIILPPQKDGDDSDPRMPLNYAHGEPKAECNARYASTPPSGVMPGYVEVQPRISQPPTGMPLEIGTGPVNEYSEDYYWRVLSITSQSDGSLRSQQLLNEHNREHVSRVWRNEWTAGLHRFADARDRLGNSYYLHSSQCFTDRSHRTFGIPYSHHKSTTATWTSPRMVCGV